MRIHLPGLLREKMRSGRYRYRVRVAGDKTRRISIPVGPGDPDFNAYYDAARRGQIADIQHPENTAITNSLGWLTHKFERHMQESVDHGLMHQSTQKQRAAFYARLREEFDFKDKKMLMPPEKVIEVRDALRSTPGAADNMVKAIRALYAWAEQNGHTPRGTNPAHGVAKINRATGAVPWSAADLRAFRKHHEPGSMAHLALTLFMFTACRLGDAYRLGRQHELKQDGIAWLSWEPEKAGSATVTIPIMPPLIQAIAAQKVIGDTYLLTAHGRPFSSKNAFGNWFRERCREAGLEGRSPHGIRKATGNLLAEEGVSQHGIMAIHGHTQAKTSEIYTADANRTKLARDAMEKMRGIAW